MLLLQVSRKKNDHQTTVNALLIRRFAPFNIEHQTNNDTFFHKWNRNADSSSFFSRSLSVYVKSASNNEWDKKMQRKKKAHPLASVWETLFWFMPSKCLPLFCSSCVMCVVSPVQCFLAMCPVPVRLDNWHALEASVLVSFQNKDNVEVPIRYQKSIQHFLGW